MNQVTVRDILHTERFIPSNITQEAMNTVVPEGYEFSINKDGSVEVSKQKLETVRELMLRTGFVPTNTPTEEVLNTLIPAYHHVVLSKDATSVRFVASI